MHPDATSEEIENFAQTQSPEFAEKYENGAEIIAIIKNNETSFFDNIYDFSKL